MKNKVYKYLTIFTITLLATSCVSSKKMVYFQEIDRLKINEDILNYEPKIKVGDILSIYVSAVEGEAVIPFNLYETPVIGNTASSSEPLTHLVNIDGEINYPVIGAFKVAGFTTKQITVNLTNVLSEYIKNPIVNIRIENFKVTVLGEVKRPGAFTITNERISIVEAIGLAGDLNIQGNRKTVLLIREQEGKRLFVTVDLTNKKLFNSPYFYLSQNDVVYVEPNKTKINSSAVGSNTGVIISSVSILFSIIALLIR